MRTRHTSHPLQAFPVYSSAFLSNNLLVLGGGGGSGKSGVRNRIRLYKVGKDANIELLDELQLGEEDAPMSMTAHVDQKELVCGINSTTGELEKGKNENCRIFSIKSKKIHPSRKCGTFQSPNVEDYQNVTALSLDHSLLAVGSTKNEVSLLWYSSLNLASPPVLLEKGQLYDAAFSPKTLVITATTHLAVYSLPKSKKGKNPLSLITTIDPPTSPVPGLTFRAARFHPKQSLFLYTVLNALPPRTRNKNLTRHAFICKWDTTTWKMVKIRKVAEKSVTCFDISSDGKYLAYGSSDYSIGILDSHTLAPLLTILKAHDFPPTTLRFNPNASLLVSGSADNSIRIIVVPESFGSAWPTTTVVILILLTLFLAVAIQQGFFQ